MLLEKSEVAVVVVVFFFFFRIKQTPYLIQVFIQALLSTAIFSSKIQFIYCLLIA